MVFLGSRKFCFVLFIRVFLFSPRLSPPTPLAPVTTSPKTNLLYRYGPDILKWKCVACKAPYKDRKKYSKAGRDHIKDLHPQKKKNKPVDPRAHLHDDKEDWVVWWWCIPLFRAPADIVKRHSVLLKVRILCFLPIGFGACCIRKRLKKKEVFHGIDNESVTDHLTGCAQRLEIMKMLGHGASSLPHGSFAHNACRLKPPDIKVSSILARSFARY